MNQTLKDIWQQYPFADIPKMESLIQKEKDLVAKANRRRLAYTLRLSQLQQEERNRLRKERAKGLDRP